jgi:hypothetical protein
MPFPRDARAPPLSLKLLNGVRITNRSRRSHLPTLGLRRPYEVNEDIPDKQN